MTKKNATKVAARARQAKLGGKYHSHLRHVQAQTEDRKTTLCVSCAPMYGYESVHAEGISHGGQCFGCGAYHEILGMFTVPNPAGGFPSNPLTRAQLKKRRIVDEDSDSLGGFEDAFSEE